MRISVQKYDKNTKVEISNELTTKVRINICLKLDNVFGTEMYQEKY